MSKKNSTGSKKPTIYDKKTLINKVLATLSNHPSKSFNYKQIATEHYITDTAQKQLISVILNDLKASGIILELYKGKYQVKKTLGNASGKVHLTSRGYAYIIREESPEDIFVSYKNLHHALDGDTVEIFTYARKPNQKIEGEVTKIIARAERNYVGIIEISKNFAFLISDNRKMPYDIFIAPDKLNGAVNGEKVIAKITNWPEVAKNPFGEVIQRLGMPGENETEMHAILAEFDLPYHFADKIIEASEEISDAITKEEISKRRDFRNITTFTIDPVDAKDFDDAISYQKLENGNIEVGVHIADVTHYVTPDSILDNESYERATSVYLVDRVVPMLPERISNNICSLRPNEDKLCYSAVFEFDNDANLKNQWFGRTVIHSDKRFAYEDAQKIIEGEDEALKEEILHLNQLAQKLRAERFKKGSIDLGRVELGFDIDEKGVPIGVKIKVQKEANQLIEEFMLMANKKVAELFIPEKLASNHKKNFNFVYRIHDKPNTEKLESFSYFIQKFGHKLDFRNEIALGKSLNQLLVDVKGQKEQNLIETLILRSMAKAKYSANNIGHYGLSFSYYTHFTSPIRRYPDMMVHRLLTDYLDNSKVSKADSLEKACLHCSEREKLASDAERASIKYKQVEYMSDKVGQVFDAVISGVSHLGIFTEIIENHCEGLVPVSSLHDDFYEYDESNYCLTGVKFQKKFQLADTVKIKVIRADLAKKQLDFELYDENAKPFPSYHESKRRFKK